MTAVAQSVNPGDLVEARPRRLAAVAIALAAVSVSAAALPLVRLPQYDPYGWLIWGREIVGGSLAFSTTSYPSWKPLGAVVGVLAQLGGAAAPLVLLVLVRSVGALGIVAACRVAAAFGGRAAGVIAAVATCLSPGWIADWLDGHLEPAVGGLLLATVWLDARGRRGLALAATTAAALARPEAFPALAVVATAVGQRQRSLRLPAIATLVLVPAIWIGGDYVGSGQFDHGGALARASQAAGAGGPLAALATAFGATAPLLVVAALVWIAIDRRRLVRPIGLLAAFAMSWAIADAVLASRGYPADPRYVVPLAAPTAVVGAVALARCAGRARSRAVATLAWVALLASPVMLIGRPPGELRAARGYSSSVSRLASLIDSAPLEQFRRSSVVTIQAFRAPAAWYTDREISAVSRLHRNGLLLVPRSVSSARYEGVIARGDARTIVARSGPWQARRLSSRVPPARQLIRASARTRG